MASPTRDAGPTPNDAATTQQRGKTASARATVDDWSALACRCDGLGITLRQLDVEQDSVDDALKAIANAKKSMKWKNQQRKKLHAKLQRAIAHAEAAASAKAAAHDMAESDAANDGAHDVDIGGASNVVVRGSDDSDQASSVASCDARSAASDCMCEYGQPGSGFTCAACLDKWDREDDEWSSPSECECIHPRGGEYCDVCWEVWEELKYWSPIDRPPRDDGTDEVERCEIERRMALSPPRTSAASSPHECVCPHGHEETEDWRDFDGNPIHAFSNKCDECLAFRLARRACEAALQVVEPDEPPDPDDPYGGASADCFYEKPPAREGDRGTRRLAGGLRFALPDELHGSERYEQPAFAPEHVRARFAVAPEHVKLNTPLEEHDPDWAPYMMIVGRDGRREIVGKSSDYYYYYDNAADVGFWLMMQNASLGEHRSVHHRRWLEDTPPPW